MEEQVKAILQKMIGGESDLGFCDPPSPLIVYANRQYPDCLWYTWDFEGNKHNPILKRAIGCIVTEIKVVEKEFRKKSEKKLQVKVQADRAYTIESGLDTQFAKGLIASLDALGGDISKPIVIEAEAGDTESVLFCRVYLDGESVRTPKHEEIDFINSLGRISLALGGAPVHASAPEASPAAEAIKSRPVGKPVAKAVEPAVVEDEETTGEWSIEDAPELDRSTLMTESSKLARAMGWNGQRAKQFITEEFPGCESRDDLNDEQLLALVTEWQSLAKVAA